MGDDMNVCSGLSSGCTSIFKMNADCVSDCMAKTYGFSAPCSKDFGALAKCGFDNCKGACISGDPDNKNCVTCNEQKCSPAFYKTAGLTIDCKYVQNCNGDSSFYL